MYVRLELCKDSEESRSPSQGVVVLERSKDLLLLLLVLSLTPNLRGNHQLA
jgi:hypothetical protein